MAINLSECPRSRSVSAPSCVTKTSPCWYGDIVPGSTLIYGSSFCTETDIERLFKILPMEATLIPLPTELTTPPVTKIYLLISVLDAYSDFGKLILLRGEIFPGKLMYLSP